jgi:tetraacyldisaccharide 4'-kinase
VISEGRDGQEPESFHDHTSELWGWAPESTSHESTEAVLGELRCPRTFFCPSRRSPVSREGLQRALDERGALRPGLWWAPLALPFGAGVLLRRWAYDHGLLPVSRPSVATVAVGGLEAGGSGKTPVTQLLLRALCRAGRRPGLLTRGYGREGHALALRARGAPALAEIIGDEPAMIVASGIDVPVAACAKRAEGARALLAQQVDCLVLDDAFQHRSLARNLDIVVLRGEAPWGNGHLLPWGLLREPRSSLGRAHVIWLHFRQNAAPKPPLWLAELAPRALYVASQAEPEKAHDTRGAPVTLAGARVVAAAGIARPEDFMASLKAQGAQVPTSFALRDHHRYTEADARALWEAVRAVGADALVVTPKDAVKLAPLWSKAPLWVLGIRVRVVAGAADLCSRLGIPLAALASPPP